MINNVKSDFLNVLWKVVEEGLVLRLSWTNVTQPFLPEQLTRLFLLGSRIFLDLCAAAAAAPEQRDRLLEDGGRLADGRNKVAQICGQVVGSLARLGDSLLGAARLDEGGAHLAGRVVEGGQVKNISNFSI